MKRFSEQFNKKAKSVKLRKAEKRDLEARLFAYMEYHPLPAELRDNKKSKNEKEVLNTGALSSAKVPFYSFFRSSAVAVALVLVAVPVLAEKAVPGDTLYAVKVRFNEEVRSTLTFNTYEKVEWETERLNRRIAEARLLASEGRLTEEIEGDVANAVRQHTASAQREIELLRVQDSDAASIASISLDTTLDVQSESLSGSGENSKNDNQEIKSQKRNLIVDAIEESRKKDDSTASINPLPAYDKIMAKVEQNTTRIYELISGVRPLVSAEESTEVNRRVDDLERAFADTVALREKADPTAHGKLIEVLQRSQRLIVYITEIEVSKSADIDSIIPIVLTEEEKLAKRAVVLEELIGKVSLIDKKLAIVEDQEVLTKASTSRKDIEEKIAELSTGDLDFEGFVGAAIVTEEMIGGVLQLLDEAINKESSIIEPGGELSSTTREVTIDDLATTSTSSAPSSVTGTLEVKNPTTTE